MHRFLKMQEAIASAQIEVNRRQERAAFLPGLDFNTGAWDIMLFLFIQHDRHVKVGEACGSSGEPRSTALRRVAALEEAGLIIRYENVRDARSQYVKLTDTGQDQMTAYFSTRMPD